MALVSSSRVSLTDITTFVFAFGSLLAENLFQIYVLYHIVSYRIVSRRIASHHITSGGCQQYFIQLQPTQKNVSP